MNSSDSTTNPQNADMSSIVDLPDGLKEFLRQVENFYSSPSASSDSCERADDILSALSKSEHLPICFPYLIKFAVDKIRVNYRRCDRVYHINGLLELLENLIINEFFFIKNFDIFNLMTNTFIMICVDVNLFSLTGEGDASTEVPKDREQNRMKAARLLRQLLEIKIGKYHSVAFINELVDGYLLKLIRVLTEKRGDAFKSALTGSVVLLCDLLGMNRSMLLKQDRFEYLNSLRRQMVERGNDTAAIDSLLDMGE
jgi:hypothetical protein